MTPRVVVFTAVFGPDVDRLRPPAHLAHDVEYHCFTDQESLSVPGWKMILEEASEAPAFQARRRKILAHITEPRCDVSIWQDSAYSLKLHPWALIQGEFQIRALRHPARDNVKCEAAELIRLGLAPDYRLAGQLRAMPFEFLRQHDKLTSTGLLVRVHTPDVRRFNECWWEELMRWGHTRDQMSVDLSAFYSGVPIEYLAGHYRDNPYADWRARRRRIA